MPDVSSRWSRATQVRQDPPQARSIATLAGSVLRFKRLAGIAVAAEVEAVQQPTPATQREHPSHPWCSQG